MARQTWARQPWFEHPIRDSELPRLFKERGRAVPYLRDLFDLGCGEADGHEIIVYSHADVMFRSDAAARIAACLQASDACYAFRRDWHHKVEQCPPDDDFYKAHHYPGSDVYAFRASWWRTHREQYPDMLLAYEASDPCMRVLIERTNPEMQVCISDLYCHERHSGPLYWEDPRNRYTLRGQLYNLALAKAFLKANGVASASHGIL